MKKTILFISIGLLISSFSLNAQTYRYIDLVVEIDPNLYGYVHTCEIDIIKEGYPTWNKENEISLSGSGSFGERSIRVRQLFGGDDFVYYCLTFYNSYGGVPLNSIQIDDYNSDVATTEFSNNNCKVKVGAKGHRWLNEFDGNRVIKISRVDTTRTKRTIYH